MKNLGRLADHQDISKRLSQLSPLDTARWGIMSVHQMICHVDDSFKYALGEKQAAPVTVPLPRMAMKWLALSAPMKWPRGVPTVPEMEQGNGGSPPLEFRQDLGSLLAILERFCVGLPTSPPHPMFGPMTAKHWMRWGYLHADHHLRQFGR